MKFSMKDKEADWDWEFEDSECLLILDIFFLIRKESWLGQAQRTTQIYINPAFDRFLLKILSHSL